MLPFLKRQLLVVFRDAGEWSSFFVEKYFFYVNDIYLYYKIICRYQALFFEEVAAI